ncbi:MAG: lamin tail domain-containing protein, partial [Candidatus Staskawiczbacteria bacterium]|nr:lamin tail domain-containing protein [Candidatus Staskawiczbacteria bacterium]
YAKSAEDHDFVDILNQVHGDLKTQKILLLGYSQGSFYSNAIYDYLVKNGVDKNSIAVYNVATPADRVAGPEGHPGKYLTSSTDRVVGGVVSGLAKVGAGKPLHANITLPIQTDEESDQFGGHYFSKDYLALAPDRIISDIDQELNNLIAGTENKDECFVQPKMGVAYYISDTGYYILDTIAKNGRALATSPYTPEQMASMGNSLFQGVYNWSSQFFSEVAGYFQQNNLFGASLASVVNQNNSQQQPALETQPAQENLLVAEENNNGTGGPDVNPTNQLEVQDLLDNIQERLDIISQQVQVLVAQQEQNNQNNYGTVASQNQSNNQTADNAETNTNTNASTNINTGAGVGGGGGSGYLKILISEVQINPIAQRFVELYNPNSSSVVLTGWYLQRKDKNDTSWGSLVSSNNFGGKEIPAHGYFIVSRQILNSNILSDITLSNDNSLALKNPNGEISDKVGFGSAIDPEFSVTINPSTGQSIGRKWDLINNTEIDTDNNSTDFEADSPTPQAQNISLPPDPTLQVSCLASPSSGDTTQQISFVSSVTGGSGVYTHSWTGDCVASTANCQKIFSTARNYTVNLSVSSGSQTQTANCSVAVSAFVPGKVLITEVQMQGANVHQDFIELYNPSVTDTVYLNNYRLVKRAQTSSGDTTIKSWAGDAVSKILPQQYYLWVSSTEAGYPASISADVSTQQNISSNNGIGLRYGAEDTGELVDSVGWGTFSNVLFEGTAFSQNHAQNFSLGRKFSSGIYQDADNNSTDFEIDTPTPKAQNITYVLLPSSDATITSTTYNVSALAGGAGTIVNVPYATSKTVFETALTKNESHQTWNDTGLSNPIATGNTLVVTAQDGTTSATYTVTVDTTNWSQGTVDSFTPAGSFTFHTGNFMPNQQTWCGFSLGYFISIYPARTNGGFFGYG